VFPVLFYLSLVWTVTCIAVLEVRVAHLWCSCVACGRANRRLVYMYMYFTYTHTHAHTHAHTQTYAHIRAAVVAARARALLSSGSGVRHTDTRRIHRQVCDILRSSSVSLDSRGSLRSSADSSRGRGADSMGASTVAHDATRPARGAVGGGLGGSGDAMGSRGGAENINLHFSEGAAHEIPEWVLEPASGQVWTLRLSPNWRCDLCLADTCACLRLCCSLALSSCPIRPALAFCTHAFTCACTHTHTHHTHSHGFHAPCSEWQLRQFGQHLPVLSYDMTRCLISYGTQMTPCATWMKARDMMPYHLVSHTLLQDILLHMPYHLVSHTLLHTAA
jgi:hypothetical protein